MKLRYLSLTVRRENFIKNDLGFENIQQIVNHIPKRYIDISVNNNIFSNEKTIVIGQVKSEVYTQKIRNNLTKVHFLIDINEDMYTAIVFNRVFLQKYLKLGQRVKIVGKINYYRQEIVVSEIYFDIKQNVVTKYDLPEGFSEKEFKSIVNKSIYLLKNEKISLNIIPDYFIKKYRLLSKLDSLQLAHNPNSMEDVKKAFRHLKYEELLELAMSLLLNKEEIKSSNNEYGKIIDFNILNNFYEELPFKLTNSQKEVITEIIEDIQNKQNMYRILQGDVGSGKSLVAFTTMLANYTSGYQSVIMAPTDLLARQLYKNLLKIMPKEVNIALLVSAIPNKEKEQIKENLAKGKIHMAVGTHALIQDDVNFAKLGLAIIDEQHRFGVMQRKKLREKGKDIDLLLMSATPIPRSLAQTIYGDLDISTLENEIITKRQVTTHVLTKQNDSSIFNKIKENLNLKSKIFVVCPLITGDEEKDVESVYKLINNKFSSHGVKMLHGKMDDSSKQSTLNEFEQGHINILVATTVIEVGIDIKNANTMIVYGSEHFGMAQLHQLRGRIARDGSIGNCYLLTNKDDEEVIERLNFLKDTEDGFKISHYDMQRRGIGDIIGTRQSGISDLKSANIIDDYHILEVARKDAKIIYAQKLNEDFANYLLRIKLKMKQNLLMLN